MKRKADTALVSGIIIIALTVLSGVLADMLGSSYIVWVLVAELLATGLTYQSLQKNTLTKIAVMPIMVVYVLLAMVFAIIMFAIPNSSEAILHIGEAVLLGAVIIAYLVINTTAHANHKES